MDWMVEDSWIWIVEVHGLDGSFSGLDGGISWIWMAEVSWIGWSLSGIGWTFFRDWMMVLKVDLVFLG
jgi:hypothetical protein